MQKLIQKTCNLIHVPDAILFVIKTISLLPLIELVKSKHYSLESIKEAHKFQMRFYFGGKMFLAFSHDSEFGA